LCECECGKQKEVRGCKLIRGDIKSCGCHRNKWDRTNTWSWKGCGEISGRYWAILQKSAKIRDIEFNLSIEYAWDLFLQQNRKCALTGSEIFFVRNYQRAGRQTASLDRINSDLGYIQGNVQWTHVDINILKNDFSQDQFIKLCTAVGECQKRKDRNFSALSSS
jgi:hypothetical protein